MGSRTSTTGGRLNRRGRSVSQGHITESAFRKEAARQGMDADTLITGLEDYVTSSYGGITLSDQLTNFIENAPESLRYGSGTIYRGLMFEDEQSWNTFLRQHSEGSTLKSRRDGLSWTGTEAVAHEFADGGGGAYEVILVNQDRRKTAVGIKNIADTWQASSDEVLYSNKRDFKVKNIRRQGRVAYVYVTEKRVE